MSKLPMLTLCAAAVALALAGCNGDRVGGSAGGEAAGADSVPLATDTGAPGDAGVGGAMPETQPSTATATPMPGVGPDAPPAVTTGITSTVVASPAPGPGGATYLTDSAGNALYVLEGNRDGSKCTGACLQSWPPLLVTDTMPTAGPGLQSRMVEIVRRPDGASQVTYNGQPLYRYAADMGAGRTSGHGVQDQWGHWYLVGPDGSKVEASH